MALLSISKIRRFFNHAPVWLRFLAWGGYFCVGLFIVKSLSYRFHNGGWDMDWAAKFEDSLFSGIFFGIYAAWPRKSVGKNEQSEEQSS